MESLGRSRFDLVMCNMVVDELRPLLAPMRDLLAADGTMLLSGILGSQRAELEAELAELGLGVERQRALGEWTALSLSRLAT